MEDIRHKLRVLTRIADALDGRGVTWAVGRRPCCTSVA